MGQVITHTLECNVPLDYAFDYVTDYALIPEWVMGVDKITPVTEQTRGVGAQFDGEVNLGPISIHLMLDFTEWEDNKAFAVHFTKGLEGTLTMHFEPVSEDRTRMNATLDYSVGKGLMARLLEKAIRAFIPACLRYVDKHLSRQLHEGYAAMSTA